MRKTLCSLFAVVVMSAAVMPAQAADQNVNGCVQLSGFNNSNIRVGFSSTDVFDGVHSCNPGSGSNCCGKNGYGSPPKNIANFLCIPNAIIYQVSSSCQSLLSQGTSTGCHSNSLSDFCPNTYPNTAQISPACNWRTNDNTSAVNWNWTLTYQNGQVTVNCSNSNYQGPEQ